MAGTDINGEQQNILEELGKDPGLYLREIHDALVERSDSRFDYSPEYGEGWNQERRDLHDLKNDLSDSGLITNDYQTWRLTKEGREAQSE